jgi:GTPase SAR1 family protein
LIEVYQCQLPLSTLTVSLNFYDFRGQIELKKEFENTSNSIFVIFFDTMNQDFVKNVTTFKKFIPKDSFIFLVGNKMDLFLDEKDSEKRLLELHSTLKSCKKELNFYDYFLITKDDITVKRMFNDMIKVKLFNKSQQINFSETKLDSDILIKLNNEIELPLHKCILSISPKFESLFEGKSMIHIDTENVDSFIALIDHLYLGREMSNEIDILKEYQIDLSDRNEQFFIHFQKNKEKYSILKFLFSHFLAKEFVLEKKFEKLILSNFSNEMISTFKTLELFDIYKCLKPSKHKENVLIWISSKVGPFDVEDLIEECSKMKLQSRLLLDRCKLWMKALNFAAGLSEKMQSETHVLPSISREELELLEIEIQKEDQNIQE